jgi:hypothetical protein
MSSSDLKVLRPLLVRVGVLLIPVYALVITVFLVDPFDFFGVSQLVPVGVKSHYVLLDEVLWKTIQFRRHPVDNILLGDSRMGLLDPRVAERVGSPSYFNYAYAGGTLPEAIDTFWLAARTTRLKSVIWGLNFNVYNETQSKINRFDNTREILRFPVKYFFNPTMMRLGYYSLEEQVFGVRTPLGKPDLDRKAFWADRLGPGAQEYYARYTYPVRLAQDLREIAKYCKDNNINLTFVAFPTHVDFQNKIHEYHLDHQYESYQSDLKALGTVMDFDYPNALTKDETNFNDPTHLTAEAEDRVAQEIFGAPRTFAHIYRPGS